MIAITCGAVRLALRRVLRIVCIIRRCGFRCACMAGAQHSVHLRLCGPHIYHMPEVASGVASPLHSRAPAVMRHGMQQRRHCTSCTSSPPVECMSDWRECVPYKSLLRISVRNTHIGNTYIVASTYTGVTTTTCLMQVT